MSTIKSWLYGPRVTEVGQKVVLRSFVLDVTTIRALMDRMDAVRLPSEEDPEPPQAFIQDLRTNAVISVENLLEMRSYELEHIRITNGLYEVAFQAGPVRLTPVVLGAQYATSPVLLALTETLEKTGSERPILRRLWALPPWLLVAAAVWALVLIPESRTFSTVLTIWTLIALSAVAATLASLQIVKSMAAYRPKTIVRPYQWRDIVGRRLVFWVAVGAAIASSALTWVLALIIKP